MQKPLMMSPYLSNDFHPTSFSSLIFKMTFYFKASDNLRESLNKCENYLWNKLERALPFIIKYLTKMFYYEVLT